MIKWYEKSGEESDIVLSTRIRFARNLKEFPFECRLKKEDKNKISKLVSDAILEGNSLSDRFNVIEVEKLEQNRAVSLVEKHLVSPEFISNKEGRTLLLSDDEEISIMINEEDHIRIQVMKEGLALNKMYDLIDKIDNLLDEKLSYAFDDKFGYLTACPTNLGTGMRASLLMHLPALQESGALSRIAADLSKLGLALRGTYGEGSSPKGALYQLSNQISLGISEIEAIKNLNNIALQLATQERNARKSMAKHEEVLDMISRSYGILSNARILNNEEFMELISNIRLGVEIGLIKGISYDTIDSLIVNSQPATLSYNSKQSLTPAQRDRVRADLVAKTLSKT